LRSLPDSANRLIDEFTRLPGIGKKTAQRLAFYIMKSKDYSTNLLSDALIDVKTKVRQCSICNGITEDDPCSICTDSRRDESILCIVEEAHDIYAFERTNSFNGRYHVLGGVLSPLDGIGPDDLYFDALLKRLQENMEIVVATNPSVEGETTSLYLAKILSGFNVKVTRLARGLPVGGNLEYIDEATLIRAMEGRTSI
jgi:recombination protein RecR